MSIKTVEIPLEECVALRAAVRERDDLRATVVRVEALADRWQYEEMPDPATADRDLRAALAGPTAPLTPEQGTGEGPEGSSAGRPGERQQDALAAAHAEIERHPCGCITRWDLTGWKSVALHRCDDHRAALAGGESDG